MLNDVFNILDRNLQKATHAFGFAMDIDFEDISYLKEDFMAEVIRGGFQAWADEKELIPHAEFLIRELRMQAGEHILDLACGDGRYSFFLCERGFAVTGVDCTDALINYLTAKNSMLRLKAKFVKSDMSKIDFNKEFDYAIILGNSLGLVAEYNATKVLMRVCSSLKPKGKLFLEIENKIYFIKAEAYSKRWHYSQRHLVLSEIYYDDIQGLEKLRDICIDRETGDVSEFLLVKRQYSFEEIKAKLNKTGFRIEIAFGDWNGDSLTDLSSKILVVAERR